MGTKMAVSFANIFMAEIETKLILQSDTKPREWNITLMTFSPFGTMIKKTWTGLLNKLTNSTLPSNSRPKYQRTK